MKNKIIKTLIFLMCYNLNIAMARDELGRLFTLPRERVALDKWRITKPKPPELPSPASHLESTDSKVSTKQKLETPDFITFNGIILRKGREPTIWLNGQKDDELKGFGIDTKTIQDKALPVFLQKLSESENPEITWAKEAIYLKPGQILDTKNSKIMEKYEYEVLLATIVETTEKVKTIAVQAKPEKQEKQEEQEESSFFGKFKSILNFGDK